MNNYALQIGQEQSGKVLVNNFTPNCKNSIRDAVLFLSVFVLVFACKPKDEILTRDGVELQFSIDTLVFDTVFTNLGTITKRLVVYNPNANAIKIASIRAGFGNASAYKLIIDGLETQAAYDVELRGKDSLLVLVTVFINPQDQNTAFVVADSIIFENGDKRQMVQLAAWGQDAVYFNNQIIGCDTTWDNNRPIVIYNLALVDTTCTLTIRPGTIIYMHNGASLLIAGTLKVEGEANSKVKFRHTRREPAFENVPGQWGGQIGGIIFLETANANSIIDHAELINPTIGIRFGKPADSDDLPDLTISNTLVENCTNTGILSISADIDLFNVVVGNCQFSTLSLVGGGAYTIHHCSFADFASFQREDPSIIFSNNIISGGNTIQSALKVTAYNSIFYGALAEELIFSLPAGSNDTLDFQNCILKTQDQALVAINGNLNVNPKFKNANQINYELDTLSPAQDAGRIITGFPLINFDFKGVSRPQPNGGAFDIGAFEREE